MLTEPLDSPGCSARRFTRVCGLPGSGHRINADLTLKNLGVGIPVPDNAVALWSECVGGSALLR